MLLHGGARMRIDPQLISALIDAVVVECAASAAVDRSAREGRKAERKAVEIVIGSVKHNPKASATRGQGLIGRYDPVGASARGAREGLQRLEGPARARVIQRRRKTRCQVMARTYQTASGAVFLCLRIHTILAEIMEAIVCHGRQRGADGD